MRKHAKVRRLNLELGPRSYEALETLQTELEASSQAEAIRLALQTLSRLVEEARNGGRLFVERDAGDRMEILLPLAPVPRPAIGTGRRKSG